MSLQDLALKVQESREEQRAAARLRLVTDRRLERGPTPIWVVDLANERTDPPLEPGWAEDAIARLDREARRQCPCQCHGAKTQRELDEDERDDLNLKRGLARWRKVLDERRGYTTSEIVLSLAAEDDE